MIILLNILSIIIQLETEKQKVTAAEIYDKYKKGMFYTAYEILKNHHEAEDAVADTMVKICRHIEDFLEKSEEEKKLLIMRYTENVAIDRYREIQRKPVEILYENADYYDDENDPGYNEDITYFEIDFHNDDFGKLQKYVMKLPVKYKKILLMKYGEGYKNYEIAKELHIPESTVATRLSRAIDKLKSLYEQDNNRGNKI